MLMLLIGFQWRVYLVSFARLSDSDAQVEASERISASHHEHVLVSRKFYR